MPWFCHPCDDYVDGNITEHFRLLHPSLDTEPETWPDGQLAITDDTVEEEFFK